MADTCKLEHRPGHLSPTPVMSPQLRPWLASRMSLLPWKANLDTVPPDRYSFGQIIMTEGDETDECEDVVGQEEEETDEDEMNVSKTGEEKVMEDDEQDSEKKEEKDLEELAEEMEMYYGDHQTKDRVPENRMIQEDQEHENEASEKILLTHRRAFQSEEELYNFSVTFGKVTDITDNHGNDIDVEAQLPETVIIEYEKISEKKNHILDLNQPDMRIIPLNQTQCWRRNENSYKNISEDQDYWKRKCDVVSEEDLLKELPEDTSIVVRMKTRKERTSYYIKETYCTFKGKKVARDEEREGKLCLYEVHKAQAVTLPGRMETVKEDFAHSCIYMSSIKTIEIVSQ